MVETTASLMEAGAVPPASSVQALADLARSLPHTTGVTVQAGGVIIRTNRDTVAEVMLILRDDARFSFEQLLDLWWMEWPRRPRRFDVVYNLLSVSFNHRLRVVVSTDEPASVPSVSGLWPCAAWWEREISHGLT